MALVLVMASRDGQTFAIPCPDAVFDSIREAQSFAGGYVLPPPAGCTWKLIAAKNATRQPQYRSIEAFLGALKGSPPRIELVMQHGETGAVFPAFTNEQLLFASEQHACNLPQLWPPLRSGCTWAMRSLADDTLRPIGPPLAIPFTVHAPNSQAVVAWMQRHCPFPCLPTLWTEDWVEFTCPCDDRLMRLFQLLRTQGWVPALDDVSVELFE